MPLPPPVPGPAPAGATGRRLRAVPVAAGPAAVEALLPALREALSGAGDAVLPHAADLPPAAGLRAGEPLAAAEDDPHDPTVVVVATSGSSGAPKGVLLSASALLASASATHDRLGGPGRWLLALPAQHVAGLQLLVRSLIARTEPVALDLTAGFTPAGFAAAARGITGSRRYTALVPTQLVRLLDDAQAGGGEGLAELTGFDAVLVGGAATPRPVLDRAVAAGVRVVTTYGASETCGGCVYDGVPLDGVRVGLEGPAGRVRLGGPTLARGYRGGDPAAAFVVDEDGTRWWRTADAGRFDGERLEVLGAWTGRCSPGGPRCSRRRWRRPCSGCLASRRPSSSASTTPSGGNVSWQRWCRPRGPSSPRSRRYERTSPRRWGPTRHRGSCSCSRPCRSSAWASRTAPRWPASPPRDDGR